MAKRQFFRVSALSGGYNPDTHPSDLADSEAEYAFNIKFDRGSGFSSREGYTRLLTSPISSVNLLSLGRWSRLFPPVTHHVLAADEDGRIFSVNYSINEVNLVYSGLSIVRGRFLSFREFTAFYNGADTPVVYDGTRAIQAGIPAPTVPPSLAPGSGSNVDGQVRYVYTYYDSISNSESNPSPEASISVSSSGVSVTVQPPALARVDRVRIYRSLPFSTGALFFVDEVPASQTTYADNTPSNALTLISPPHDNDLPLAFSSMAYNHGHLFGATKTHLYWSKPYSYDAWPALSNVEIPFEGNDSIVAVWSHQDSLLVFGKQNILVVNGVPPDISVTRLDVHLGAMSPDAMAEVGGSLIFLSHQGLYTFPGLNPLASKLSRTLMDYPKPSLESATLVNVPQEKSVWLNIGGKTYTVYLPTQAISIYSLTSQAWLSGGVDGVSKPLFVDGSYINQYGGTSDLGLPIPILWKSKIFKLPNPETVKYFRKVGAYATAGSSNSITVSIADGVSSYSVQLESAQGQSQSLWDSMQWDDSQWATEGVWYVVGALPGQILHGHTVQLSVTSDTIGPMEFIPPITLEYRETLRLFGGS